MMAFGQPVNTIYDFSKADRILSLDADFLSALPGTLRYARNFAAKRRVTEGKKEMTRLYVVETTPTTRNYQGGDGSGRQNRRDRNRRCPD